MLQKLRGMKQKMLSCVCRRPPGRGGMGSGSRKTRSTCRETWQEERTVCVAAQKNSRASHAMGIISRLIWPRYRLCLRSIGIRGREEIYIQLSYSFINIICIVFYLPNVFQMHLAMVCVCVCGGEGGLFVCSFFATMHDYRTLFGKCCRSID